jgi:hypothetical protein
VQTIRRNFHKARHIAATMGYKLPTTQLDTPVFRSTQLMRCKKDGAQHADHDPEGFG